MRALPISGVASPAALNCVQPSFTRTPETERDVEAGVLRGAQPRVGGAQRCRRGRRLAARRRRGDVGDAAAADADGDHAVLAGRQGAEALAEQHCVPVARRQLGVVDELERVDVGGAEPEQVAVVADERARDIGRAAARPPRSGTRRRRSATPASRSGSTAPARRARSPLCFCAAVGRTRPLRASRSLRPACVGRMRAAALADAGSARARSATRMARRGFMAPETPSGSETCV